LSYFAQKAVYNKVKTYAINHFMRNSVIFRRVCCLSDKCLTLGIGYNERVIFLWLNFKLIIMITDRCVMVAT